MVPLKQNFGRGSELSMSSPSCMGEWSCLVIYYNDSVSFLARRLMNQYVCFAYQQTFQAQELHNGGHRTPLMRTASSPDLKSRQQPA